MYIVGFEWNRAPDNSNGAAFLVGRYCLAFLTANNRLPAYSVSHPCPPPFSQPSVISGHALSVLMSVCLSLSLSVCFSHSLSVCLSLSLDFTFVLLCFIIALFACCKVLESCLVLSRTLFCLSYLYSCLMYCVCHHGHSQVCKKRKKEKKKRSRLVFESLSLCK